jgi:hypothetical protein
MDLPVKRNNVLVLTSSLFLIPGTYMLVYKKSIFSSMITYSISITSMNYWLNPSKENLFYDHLTSYTGCFFYVINSVYYLPTIEIKGLAITSVLLYYLVFCLSCHLYKANNEKWIICHIIFHLLVFSSKWVLYLNM